MTEPVLFEVPASSLTGFSVKIRCGPPGTRLPIISRSSSEDTLSSTNPSPCSEKCPEHIEAGDSFERAVHLCFGDDRQGAFLKLSFAPDPEPVIRNQQNLLNHSATSSSWPNPTSFSASMADAMLWNNADPTLNIPNQTCPSPSDSHRFFPEHIAQGSTLNQVTETNSHLSHMQGTNPISPFPNNVHDFDSLVSILSRNVSTSLVSAPVAMTSPGSNYSPSPNGPLSQTESSSPSPSSAPSPDPTDFDLNSHPYSCPQPGCNRRFKREYNLSLHIRTHEPRPKKRFMCAFPECNGLKFSRKHDLFRHICNLHSDTAAWTCDWCRSEFPNSEALVAHIRIHYENEAGNQTPS